MKKLSIEEKAERYDEAIAMAKECITYIPDEAVNKYMLNMFPELKESEDDRIRKAIHIYLDWLDGRKDYAPKGVYTIRDMIAWIEKQGEQKSVEDIAKEVIKDKESAVQFLKSAGIMDSNGELAKEYRDEQNLVESTDDLAPLLQGYIPTIMNKHGMPEIEADAITETAYYFYSLGKKEQDKPVEWSEEDDDMLSSFKTAINCAAALGTVPQKAKEVEEWANSLKGRCVPQKQWKPSDEQINALYDVLNPCDDVDKDALVSLYEQLKKLKDE